MHRISVYFADSAGPGDDIRQQINALANAVREQPENEVALLKLTHLYAQLWIKTQQAEILPRILLCLDRSVMLETGQYARQVHQLIEGVTRHAEAHNLEDALAKLQEINQKLNAKLGGMETTQPAQEPPPSVPAKGSSPEQVPAPSPANLAPPAAVESVSAEEEEIEMTPDILGMMRPKTEEKEKQPAPSSDTSSVSQKSFSPSADMEMEVETVEEMNHILSGTASSDDKTLDNFDEETSAESFAEDFAGSERSVEQEFASAQAGSMIEIQTLFKEGQIGEIIQTYAAVTGIRIKRYIIEQLGARIKEWRIEPLLAVGALERDEQIFRHILRVFLKQDRKEIVQQIDLEKYSIDLQRVAAVVLSELSSRAALPKLSQCLDSSDAGVRLSGVNGLIRLGAASAERMPKLVEMLRLDPNLEVRHAAAQALSAIGTKEAYEAFEAAAGRTQFDGVIYAELDKMREKFGVKKEVKKGAKKELTAEQKAKRTQYIVLAVIFVILLIVAWKMGFIGGSTPPPPE